MNDLALSLSFLIVCMSNFPSFSSSSVSLFPLAQCREIISHTEILIEELFFPLFFNFYFLKSVLFVLFFIVLEADRMVVRAWVSGWPGSAGLLLAMWPKASYLLLLLYVLKCATKRIYVMAISGCQLDSIWNEFTLQNWRVHLWSRSWDWKTESSDLDLGMEILRHSGHEKLRPRQCSARL